MEWGGLRLCWASLNGQELGWSKVGAHPMPPANIRGAALLQTPDSPSWGSFMLQLHRRQTLTGGGEETPKTNTGPAACLSCNPSSGSLCGENPLILPFSKERAQAKAPFPPGPAPESVSRFCSFKAKPPLGSWRLLEHEPE